MASIRYRRFLKLCEEWPVDETRRGRDLGAFLRQRVAQAFREGENTQGKGPYVKLGTVPPNQGHLGEKPCATKEYIEGLLPENCTHVNKPGTPRKPEIQDPEVCDQMYESLNRINSNYYREKYPRLQDTSFTEITAEEYRMVLATDTLKQMDEMKRGVWKRLMDKFNAKSPQDGAKE